MYLLKILAKIEIVYANYFQLSAMVLQSPVITRRQNFTPHKVNLPKKKCRRRRQLKKQQIHKTTMLRATIVEMTKYQLSERPNDKLSTTLNLCIKKPKTRIETKIEA